VGGTIWYEYLNDLYFYYEQNMYINMNKRCIYIKFWWNNYFYIEFPITIFVFLRLQNSTFIKNILYVGFKIEY